MEIHAFTDGCSLGNPGNSGCAAILSAINDNGVLLKERTVSKSLGHSTNNIAELSAVLLVVEVLKPGATVNIHADSDLVIGWLEGVYKRKNPAIKAKCEEIESLSRQKNISLAFIKVEGHMGDEYNEMADAAAKLAARGVTSD